MGDGHGASSAPEGFLVLMTVLRNLSSSAASGLEFPVAIYLPATLVEEREEGSPGHLLNHQYQVSQYQNRRQQRQVAITTEGFNGESKYIGGTFEKGLQSPRHSNRERGLII